jgi:hypothetical protein
LQPSGGLPTLLWLIGGKHCAFTALSMGRTRKGRKEGIKKKRKEKKENIANMKIHIVFFLLLTSNGN